MRRLPSLLALLALPALASFARAADLTVFAAASLSDSLREAGAAYSAETGRSLRFNFGGSGTLARQIKDGAPADVFISADELRLDQLIDARLLRADTRRALLANTLVVVVSTERRDELKLATLGDLGDTRFRRLALGDPATVPAGSYAKQQLGRLDLWTALEAKVLPLDSVRAALAAVESGNAEAGFVYKTDALASRKVAVVFEVPPAEGPRVVYPAAVVTDSKNPDAATALIAWLAAPKAQALFARHGFLAP